ncbi:MAG: HD domain-containing phosphohydrolase, partial [Nocardioidaceae bacterium]
MEDDDRGGGVRLAEIVAAFSLATDLGLGLPLEHLMRSWLISARLVDRLDLEPEAREFLYYVVTLAWAGCVADTPEVAAWFGDDITFRRDSFGVDRAGLSMLAFSLRHVGVGGSALHRLRLAAALLATGGAGIQRGLMSHCLTTASMAERLGLGSDVCEPLQQVFTRWDGKGVPAGIGG